MSRGRVGVVGGGLAGIATALAAADAGADVELFERRGVLGGLTSSMERNGLWFDNGQHVFLRCCTAYLAFLERIGARGMVHLQDRMDVAVLSPSGTRSSLRRQPLPAPLHLGWSLATYRHLSARERLGLVRAALALRALDLDDPSLDTWTFGDWLRSKGQSPAAIERLWNLIALPTINLDASEASLALAAKVFREGLLDRADSGDVGWSLVPLARLHGEQHQALRAAGVTVRQSAPVHGVEPDPSASRVSVRTASGDAEFDAVVVATPPTAAAALGVSDAVEPADRLGTSPIVNVHVVFDRTVTDLAMFAAVDSPVQFVFDRTSSCGLGDGQCLSVSLSAATSYMAAGAPTLIDEFAAALRDLLPDARRANVVDGVVTRERAATFRGVPGTHAARPTSTTSTPGVFLAGAWCDTGWPATMEGAVRSGTEAARCALAHLAGSPDLGRVRDGIAPVSIETTVRAPSGAGIANQALARARSAVVPALEATLPRLSPELQTSVGEHLLVGGKHVRAGLVLVGAAACGIGEQTAIDGAVAIELVHNFSLVHDDIIDNDVERRHRPTLWSGHGVNHAIIAGDALAVAALQVLLDRPTPERARAAAHLADATQSMIAGQMLDMAFERREAVTLEECLEMVVGKTGALLQCAAQLGPILGGADELAVEALGAFGHHLGIAFQAIDDVLGIWGDPDVTGKPVGSDLRRRKMTLPICIARAEGVELEKPWEGRALS